MLTYGWQGYYYKDYDSYKSGNDVCYIPEFASDNQIGDCIVVPLDKSNDSIYYRKNIINAVEKELNKVYMDFFENKIPSKLVEQIAENVIDIVDWEHPESYIYETEWDEEINEYFDMNKDDIDIYASDKLKAELKGEEIIYG